MIKRTNDRGKILILDPKPKIAPIGVVANLVAVPAMAVAVPAVGVCLVLSAFWTGAAQFRYFGQAWRTILGSRDNQPGQRGIRLAGGGGLHA